MSTDKLHVGHRPVYPRGAGPRTVTLFRQDAGSGYSEVAELTLPDARKLLASLADAIEGARAARTRDKKKPPPKPASPGRRDAGKGE